MSGKIADEILGTGPGFVGAMQHYIENEQKSETY